MDRDEKRRLERNLREAFELHEAGIALMRQNLRRRHPEAAEQEIARLLAEWLQSRPLGGPGFRPSHKLDHLLESRSPKRLGNRD